jgi:hypothetical protein
MAKSAIMLDEEGPVGSRACSTGLERLVPTACVPLRERLGHPGGTAHIADVPLHRWH